MKFIKFTSIIALQALTACGGGSESGTEGTEISSLSTLTQHTHSAQQTSHTYAQGIAEQLNSTPATSLYTEQQVDHVNGQDEQQESEQQNTHPTQGLQQVWRRYVNTVKNTATQNVSDQFKPKQLLLTYPTNATEQIDTSSNLPPIDSILNPIPIDSLETQGLPLVYSKHTSSMLFPAPTMRPNVEQQTNLSDGQDKKVETEPQETPLTQSSGQLQSNSINELKAEPPSSFTQDFTPGKTYGEPITPPDEEQKTNHISVTQKEGGGKSTGNEATIPTPPRSPSFSDQSYSLDIDSEESQSLGQQPDSHVHTNNITAINTDHASGTKNPTESKISDNMDKATMIVTREEKPAQIPVQELLNEENNYPDFQDAAILLIFNANNHFAATLVKDDENNWYGISNYFSEKIIKLQTNHKNWLDQNILNKEKTKIVYFTQRQLDNIEPITIDELTNSLASLPEQTDQSIIDALGELPSGSICVEQSSTEDEAKWVRSFLENIFFSKELLTNDHIDKLKKAVMHSRAKRQISDDTESFIKEALNSIKDCAPNDESYKAMVNNRRIILYKSFGMIKNHDINTFKIDPIIYNSIISFYGNPYLSYSPEEENSFIEVANNNKIKRAITDDEDFVIININTP